MSDTGGESTDFLYPFIEGDEREVAPLLAASPGRRRPRQRRALSSARRRRRGCASSWPQRPTSWRPGSPRAGGCSPSATAAARPTPASLAALFARPPWGRPLPARSPGRRPAVLTALANDVGFELVFSRQLIATAHPGDIAVGLSTSGGSRNLLRPSPRRDAGAAHGRSGRATTAARWRCRPTCDHCLVVRSDSVHRIQETQAALGLRPVGRASSARLDRRPVADGRCDREAAVLERIEAFRRRRPRLTDEIVTLAHGAGGKSSAALVDAVFLEAFADGEPGPLGRRRHARPAERASGWRSAPTPSSCSPCASPAARSGTSPCTAPSTTSPCSGPGRDGCRPRS